MGHKIFIIGYYGSQNMGDELILESTIGLIRKQVPEADIRVLTYATSETSKRFKVTGVSRNDFSEIFKTIHWCDTVVGGGGSMLQNVTSNRSLLYYLALIKVAQFHKKQIILLGNGVGPLVGKYYKTMTFSILKSLKKIVLRDEASFITLKAAGLTNIVLGQDLAFNLEKSVHNNPVKPLILLNLRPWQTAILADSWVPAFIQTWTAKGYEIGLLSMQAGKDDVLLKPFESETVKLYSNMEGSALIGLMESAELVVAMRLHALIFSAIAGTPFVGIDYDPKIDHFITETQQLKACKTENMNGPAINAAVEKALANRADYTLLLSQSLEGFKGRILENEKAAAGV